MEDFRPEEYHDEVREKMLELIQRKVDGEEIATVSSSEPQTKIIDLMAALKASLEEGPEADAVDPKRAASG